MRGTLFLPPPARLLNELTGRAPLHAPPPRSSGPMVLVGPSGVGKTHIAIALGQLAAKAGVKTRFYTAADLMLTLSTAARQNNLPEVMKRSIGIYRLLIGPVDPNIAAEASSLEG